MENAELGYTIGVVARRTNINPETLRVWERRYQMVVPQRNLTGRRLYTEDDILKLSLVKKLTEAGHPVSGLADLTIDALRSRLSASAPTAQAVTQLAHQICRVIISGESLGLRMKREKQLSADINIVACIRTEENLAAVAKVYPAEVLVSEFTTINHETLNLVRRQLSQSRCHGAIVVFSFGTRSVIGQLEQAGILCMKASLTAAELRRACLSLRPAQQAPLTSPATPVSAPTPRRFDAQQLAEIVSLSGSIACECPNHLAELVASLNAFEQYSSECANRNASDRELHAHLHQSAGFARAILEDCLVKVMEIEGIKI
jgi:DNA-binding transcriptional MerR regulator